MSGLIRKEEEIYENCNYLLIQRVQISLPNTRRFITWREISKNCTLKIICTASICTSMGWSCESKSDAKMQEKC